MFTFLCLCLSVFYSDFISLILVCFTILSFLTSVYLTFPLTLPLPSQPFLALPLLSFPLRNAVTLWLNFRHIALLPLLYRPLSPYVSPNISYSAYFLSFPFLSFRFVYFGFLSFPYFPFSLLSSLPFLSFLFHCFIIFSLYYPLFLFFLFSFISFPSLPFLS